METPSNNNPPSPPTTNNTHNTIPPPSNHTPQRHSPTATSSPIIYLNVGGYTYATSQTTLQMDPNSMLSRMFSGLLPTTLVCERKIEK